MFQSAPTPYLTLADVAVTFNAATATRGEQPLSAKSVGWLVRGKLGLETMKTRGVYVIPQSERSKVTALAARFGLPPEQAVIAPEIETLGFLARSAKYAPHA